VVRYVEPRVVDYGDLRQLTAADFGFLVAGPEGGSALAAMSPPMFPPPTGDGQPPDVVVNPPDVVVNPPDVVVNPPDVNIEVPTGGPPTITEVSGPGGGGGAPAAGGGGELPVTGFPAALVGAIGSGLAGLGVALRRFTTRR
jgi:hypothetical protein